jgi:hypothetical protein
MPVSINFNGATLVTLGAYSYTQIAETAAQEAQLGVVALIGESDEGPAWAAETKGLDGVTFTAQQYGAIQQKYGSGPLVDGSKLALSPSADEVIKGGAQQLVTMQTNQSVKASLALASSYGTIKAKRYGKPGNNINATIAVASSQATITLNRADLGITEISNAIGGTGVMTIQCTDGAISAATLSISATTLTTTITGGTAASLSIPLSQFNTIGDLAAYIATQTGYTATVATAQQQNQPLSVMDRVSAVDIKTAPYTVKRDAADIQAFFATSQLVDFTPGSAGYLGIPAALTKTYLTGGAKGATSQANFQTCLDALSASNCNFIVPLFSRDATGGDIADGLTESTSSYLISSVHAAVRSHCVAQSAIKARRERQAWVGFQSDTYSAVKDAAANLGAGRVSLLFQRCDIAGASGISATSQPHMLAVIAAAMKAAAPVGLPNHFKKPAINGFQTVNSSGAAFFNPVTDAEDALNAGLTFVEKAPGGGFRFHCDNSTYGQATNAWFYARPAVQYAADIAAKVIRLNLESFVGNRNSDVSVTTVTNFMIGVLDKLRTAGIIVGDKSSNGTGYKNLSVSISGSVVTISVGLVLVEGLEFLLSSLSVSRAQS